MQGERTGLQTLSVVAVQLEVLNWPVGHAPLHCTIEQRGARQHDAACRELAREEGHGVNAQLKRSAGGRRLLGHARAQTQVQRAHTQPPPQLTSVQTLLVVMSHAVDAYWVSEQAVHCRDVGGEGGEVRGAASGAHGGA